MADGFLSFASCATLFCMLGSSYALGKDMTVEVQHVKNPDTIAKADAIIPLANWTVRPGAAPLSLTDDQVRQFVLAATNEWLVEDLKVCGYHFRDVTGDSTYTLEVILDASGRGFCNFAELIRRSASGYDISSVDGYLRSFQDLDGDGIPEYSRMETYSNYEGANGCQAEWTSQFKWNGSSWAKSDPLYPAWYQKRHDDLTKLIADAQQEPPTDAGFELDESCDIMERDRIERFLGTDPKAGLDRALQWASSGNEQLMTRAVVVLSDINDPAAIAALQRLALGSDEAAGDAKDALHGPSYSLALVSSTAVLSPVERPASLWATR